MQADKLSTRKILDNNRKRRLPREMPKLRIVLHNLRSMHNVGAAFRNADAFGIDELLLSGYTPTPPRAEITKTAIGAEEYVEWNYIKKIAPHLSGLAGRGYRIVGVEQTTNSVLLPDYHPPAEQHICLVFGNEVTGIDEELFPVIDDFIEIPQYGRKHSLNVSVSVGVVLYGILSIFWAR